MIREIPKGWTPIEKNHDSFACMHKVKGVRVIASWGLDWDHVSVSVVGGRKIPSYKTMRFVHSVFFPGEIAVEYHMPPSKHISPGIDLPSKLGLQGTEVLHLWRCQTQEMPTPPRGLV